MEIPIAAELIFTIPIVGIPITNSVLTGWIVVSFFAVIGLSLRRKTQLVPKGLQNAAEALLEYMLDFMDQVTNDRARSRKFFPIVGTIFLFIIVANLMSMFPGVGTIGIWGLEGGELLLIPLFRPATSDLNMTLAMSISAVVISHMFGIFTIGFFTHWNKFIQLGTVWNAIKGFRRLKFSEAVIGMFTALIEFGVGIIELIGEAAKMISLSLRLFGNTFAGEVLLYVLASLVALLVPTPFMFLEIIVAIIQALVFSMLVLVYLTLATELPHGSEEAHKEDELSEAHGTGSEHEQMTEKAHA